MKILIMGTGAIGGCYGGLLARSGEDVLFVARGENLKTISERGLRVESATYGNFTVHPRVVEKPDSKWKAELILFCVKGYHNETAMETMAPAIDDSTSILTLQNGIGGGDQLAKRFGKDKVLLGAAYIDAERKSPGIVAHTGSSPRIVFGEIDGTTSQRAITIRDTLQNSGIEAQLSADILVDLWSKLIYICALSGMSCITRASFAEVMNTPETRELTRRVMEEAYAVARATGVRLVENMVEKTMQTFAETSTELVSSMYADLRAGNPLELSVINSSICRIGKELNIPTPVNDFITSCLTIADKGGRTGNQI